FWGTMKIGAVPVPLNTLLRPNDYAYILNDCRAETLIVSDALAGAIEEVRPKLTHLKNIVVAGDSSRGGIAYEALTGSESAELTPADTTRDDVAFWLYTSGTTGTPK